MGSPDRCVVGSVVAAAAQTKAKRRRASVGRHWCYYYRRPTKPLKTRMSRCEAHQMIAMRMNLDYGYIDLPESVAAVQAARLRFCVDKGLC